MGDEISNLKGELNSLFVSSLPCPCSHSLAHRFPRLGGLMSVPEGRPLHIRGKFDISREFEVHLLLLMQSLLPPSLAEILSVP